MQEDLQTKTPVDTSVTIAEIEGAIEVLHGDIRSIGRQIKQRALRLEIDDSLGKTASEDRSNHNFWLKKVERVIDNKFDQIRMLERSLGDIRGGSISPVSRAHLHVRILKEIAVAVDDSIGTMEDKKLKSFTENDVALLKKLVDYLDGMWPELFDS